MERVDATTAAAVRGGRWLVRGSMVRLLSLAGAALLLQLVLLLGLLNPLSIGRYPEVVPTDRPLATVLGTDLAGALRFAVPMAGAFAALVLALWLARGLAGRAAFALVLLASALFSLTLLPTNPLGAQDIYHNIADARTTWLYGDNPTVLPPNAFPDDPLYQHVPAWQDFPSAYGPVWYAVAGAPIPFAGDSLWRNVIGQKAVTALFLLGATLLAMLVAGQIRPGAAASAGVLVGWNPLLQFETAGNAHNDVVMVFFALAALYAVTRRWWVAVFPLLALSVASKYVLVLLGPVLLVWMLRRRDVPRRQVMLSLALGMVVGIATYVPFFAGPETLTIFRRQTSFNTSSPSALLDALMWSWMHMDVLRSAFVMKLIVVPLFLVGYAVLLLRIPRDPGVVALARTGFWTVFLLLVVATWWFWPWYLLWLVPLGALLPGSRPALLAAVFSATAMAMYIPYFWLLGGDGFVLQAATAGTAFLLPVLLALAPRLSRTAALAEPQGALAGD